jgi:hypothetical protein
MPAAIKRRKVAATSRNASSADSHGRGIASFARVSKASSADKAGIEKKSYDTIAITPYSLGEKKRKLLDIEESSTEHVSSTISASITERDIKPLPRRSNDSQICPRTPQKPITNTESSSDTPMKGARSLFNQLFVSKPPTKPSLHGEKHNHSTLVPTAELPIELLDLINLHAAFLTTLSLHYAHNGTHSPADVRMLCLNVSRTWGKRAVTLADIRRSLGVTNGSISEGTTDPRISRLSLSDYGEGKICIEMRAASGKAGRMPRPLNENLLNEIYVRGLKAAWEERGYDMKPLEFITSLPLEPITTCSSSIKMSPLLAKGQRRLEDLNVGIIVKKGYPKESPVGACSGTKPTLLERLRAKQLHQSTLPAPPSKAAVGRRAALQRIDEVVAVLAILSTSASIGQQRISFTVPNVLGKLRDSLRTPMSKEEGTTCVRLLASEVAPEWVQIVKMGKVEALVVNLDARPTELDIKERVKRAG